jgi:DNA-binding PadR family transcriptional regulator
MAMADPARPRSPLALVLLALIWEGPMHPYRMQQLIEQRGKDRIANVARRNSVYQTIESLRHSGLIAVKETARDEGRPERTVYEITEEGDRTLRLWLSTMLSAPAREFPDFPAALSIVALLTPEVAADLLEQRARRLAERLAELSDEGGGVPRLFVIEDEYQRVMTEAELGWVRGVIADLRSGRLAWDPEWILRVAEAMGHVPGSGPE